ncbi:MAG TPA: hypothetical protein VHE30_14430 [Polyangiaceae bacterium]|nr:hypothetical protein [Polyangiaceae bacterium]
MKIARTWVGALSAVLALGCSAAGGSQDGPSASAGGAPFGSGAGGSSGAPGDASGGTGILDVPGPGAGGGTPDGGSATGSGGSGGQPSGPTPERVDIDRCTGSNAANLDAAATQRLIAGGGGPGGLRLLNPYDGTVFPRGLQAPLLMWDGATADALYVHLRSSLFDYKACVLPSGPGQFQVPAEVWKQASDQARGPSDPFTLEVTVSSAGTIIGPATEQLIIAQATIKGSIFYNSYASKLVSGLGTGGAVLRISPPDQAKVVIGQQGCTGCHSVSANGTRLTTQNFSLLPSGASYTVPQGSGDPTTLDGTAPQTDFTALSPDGSIYVTNAHQGFPVVGPRTGPTNLGTSGAAVYDTTTGAAIQNTGVPATVMTPSFSPDGKLLAFTDYAITQGHGLAVMDFDQGARTASGYRQVYTSPGAAYPAWPFALPDDRALVFALGALSDFSGGGVGIQSGGTAASAPASDLYITDLGSGQSRLLARAMGFASEQDASSNTTYLPFGAAEELHHNYYPTMSPVAAGGYFWVFFDSFRHYGNLGLMRQLWGTAIDISADGTYTADPSHPPFYLTGQELGTGNHRAFTALDPCKKDGDSCETGIDCCGGFCTDGVCGVPPPPPPVPGEPPPPPRCAHTDEGCSSTACCDTRDKCIAGFCGRLLR